MPPIPSIPRYGERSLADLLPAIFGTPSSALPARGRENLEIESAERVCLLLVDGLGWELLRTNGQTAPFLNSLAQEPLTAGFPATTVASISSLATGLPPGQHGLVGYTLAIPGQSRALNVLTWSLYGIGPRASLLDQFVPERVQAEPTMVERAAENGVRVTRIGPPVHDGSGLTRAVWRGGQFRAAETLEGVITTALGALSATPSFVYAYHPRLDTAGHVYGVASQEWRDELASIDRSVRAFADRLPPGSLLVITGDHGMVDLSADQRLDVADHPELRAGVRLLAGEARARYVYTQSGAQADVLAAWQATLGDRMWIWTREEAIATGAFGPVIAANVAQRIGDIVAAAYAPIGIVEREVDPAQTRLVGHHGSFTAAEQLVPLLLYRS
ncbi:MAG: alkaline phosphatase family protein [Candidatus Dormibacteraeota bacterium]|nr:alkaline phosphatase family protein [Candidatus Dormibacteraeota bacterium]